MIDAEMKNQIITVWDGTYVYIQKSANYQFQKQSYSTHKHRSLVKPILAVTISGYIIEAFGPYPANYSDSKLLENIMDTESFKKCYRPGDIFIVDRGFRDVIPKLEINGFIVKMPSFIDKNKKQLTTEQANNSRRVTKMRFVIEVINGILKSKFRYFDKVWNNHSIPHLMEDFRIACAICNAYFPKIDSDKEDYEIIAERMLNKLHKPNLLMDFIIDTGLLRKRKIFTVMNAEIFPEFPKLTLENLYYIALGKYQIKQAVSYYGEHIDKNGKYEIQVYNEVENINFTKYGLIVRTLLFIRTQLLSGN